MLGVFKRRWKPKSTAKANNNLNNKNSHLVTNYNLYSEPVLSIDGQFDKIISPSTRQIHSLCDEKAQLAVAYETIKSLPPSHSPSSPLSNGVFPSATTTPLLNPYAVSHVPSPTLSENGSPALSITRTPNICVEDGRIEFVKDGVDGVLARANVVSIAANNNNNHYRESTRHSRDEKIDDVKECLEARIGELEKALDAERKLVQREKLATARLQRQLSRKELIQRDVDRERRLRSDSEARLRRSESDTERCRAKLAVLQREFIRMEDTVRSMLQYKTKYEQLKQDKASLTIACENHIQHFQNIICKIKNENEELKKELESLNSSQEANSEVQSVLLERIEVLQNQNAKLMREGETQRKQYEKCLDDVANQVVKALLTQKNLQDDVNRLQQRVKELESNNNSLSTLLLQRVQRASGTSGTAAGNSQNCSSITHSSATGRYCQAIACLQSSLCNKLNIIAKKVEQQRPISLDERRLRRIYDRASSNNLIWVSLQRPQSLTLETNSFLTIDKIKKKAEEESPESVIRDEGYSTMSSDVQCTNEVPPKALEELKEVTDETDAPPYRIASLGNKLTRSRNSIPFVKHLLPYQHIMRSFSDSQLCLRITTSSFKSSSAAAALTGGYYHNYLNHHYHHRHHPNAAQQQPFRAARVASLLEVTVKEEDTEDGFSFCSSDLFDTEYIQQWLQLDEKRTLMQQLQLEYNAAEVEDWSMEDTENWKKVETFSKFPNNENDAANASKLVVKNLWDIATYPTDGADVKRVAWVEDDHQNSLSSDSSWSSSATNSEERCVSPFDNSSKRSSSVMSSENSEGAAVGTDFTRDFYRLVKFESSKSLASSSTKSQRGFDTKAYSELLTTRDDSAVDREQALQSVLKFIAEQQCYCISRLVQDEQKPEQQQQQLVVAICDADLSHDAHTLADEDDGYFSKISFDNGTGSEDAVAEDRSCCTDTGTSTHCDSESQATSSAAAVDYKTLFRTCDSCFQNMEPHANEEQREQNMCGKCAESYIQCLPEEVSSPECVSEADPKLVRYAGPTASMSAPKSCLDTVLEEQEEVASGELVEPAKTAEENPAFVSLHERATSKEMIEELNRMIRKGDEFSEPHDRATPVTDLDDSCGCSTGWVHVEQDIDFNDPKARANLLDVMLASSSSSSCDSSRNNSDSENVDEDRRNYKHLHRLHRVRRQRRASASRQPIMGALRFSTCVRPSIIGRDNFFNRYGEKEREAVASFDFLEELSTTSLSTASEPSDNASCSAKSSSRTRHSVGLGSGKRAASSVYSRCTSADCDSCCDRFSCSE